MLGAKQRDRKVPIFFFLIEMPKSASRYRGEVFNFQYFVNKDIRQ